MVAVTAGVLPVFLVGALAVQERASLSLGASAIGEAVAVFYAAAAASSAWGGRLSQRLGAACLMRVSLLASLASVVEVAVGARNFWMLALGMMFGGLANGIGQPASNQFLSLSVRPGRQGVAFGIKQAAIPVATLLAGLSVPAVALTIGWRWAFSMAAVMPIVGWIIVPPCARSNQNGTALAGRTPKLAIGALVVLAIGGGLGSAAGNALGAFLVQSAVASGFGPGQAGLLAALGSAFGLAGRLASGFAADRRQGGHLLVIASMLVVGAVGFVLLASARSHSLGVAGTVIAFGAGWGWNGLFNLAVVKSHPDAAGAATGISQTGVLVGGAAGPVAFGLAVDSFGYGTAWLATAAAAVAAAAAMATARTLLLRHRAQLTSGHEAAPA